ncbi:2OG-Fe(II) oxygenase [Leucothrix sargassi]|nr:2OG-Fe(II) oxygenase [Leucothrix sargassi]
MSLKPLSLARVLPLPSREEMLNRSPAVQQFWNDNQELLSQAWQEWEDENKDNLSAPDTSLLDADLREAVTSAWQDPSSETAMQPLFKEVMPDVYEFQFFDPERLADLRKYLEALWDAQIPLRPPYGIVLNRGGAMLDSRSEGHLGAPSFQRFYNEVLNDYMRPISRLLFPEITGYDTQTFGFSIRYQPTTDASIRPHTDASSVTMNVNLNLPDEAFTGSAVNFYNQITGEIKPVTFKPGSALIHRGHVVHAAMPITSGERTNFVFWLYGQYGQIPPQGVTRESVSAQTRWTKSTVESDGFSPF